MGSTENKWYAKWWASGILLPVVATVIGTGTYDTIKDKPIFFTLWQVILWIVNKTVDILNLQLRLWQIFLIILIIAVIRGIIKTLSKKEAALEPQIEFLKYKRDRLKKWMWTWNYTVDHYTKKYQIVDMQPVCENCNIKMLGDASFGRSASNYKCPKCDKAFTEYGYGFEYQSDIEALIIHNIENGHIIGH